ncbi:MAG TPA: ABC transporter ATP-binding protein [Gammaproteobacteria bacterium]|nr:ABC transporter ATP-binding protein [Gammaproteobacteria bacterium]
MIQVDALRFRYRGAQTDAIDALSLDIKTGSLFGLLGPNGSGKTTLISLLSGLLTAQSGQIRINDRPMPEERRAIQMDMALVPQEYAFYPRLSVIENLRFFAGAQNVGAPLRRNRIAEAVAATGLGGFEKKRAQHLSGGLKRRLNLAIGLLNAPRVLFLDEPTVGIDPQSRHFILEAIKRINADGTTIIYTSHYMEEVEALCDEIAILDQGRVIARGDLQALLGHEQGGPLTIGLSPGRTASDLQPRLGDIPDARISDSEISLPKCPQAQLYALLDRLAQADIGITRIRYGYSDLEDLFLRMTGHQLRD